MDHSLSFPFHNFSQNLPTESNNKNNFAPKEVVVLSKILQHELAKAKRVNEAHRIIIRCDELPVIEGHQADFENLFGGILNLMLKHPVKGKQLLSIQCKEEDNSKSVTSTIGLKSYAIQFHTNIALEPYWQVTYHAPLKEYGQIAARYNGQLIINTTNSGCLLTLHLSGKSF